MPAKKPDPTAALAQALKDAIHGEKAPEDHEALIKALLRSPEKEILRNALRAATGGRVVLKKGSEEVDIAQTVAFMKHIGNIDFYDAAKFMGQRIAYFDALTKPAKVSDPFYAAAGLAPVYLTAEGINPESGTKYPTGDADMMERIAFVAGRVKVGDPTDCEDVQPIVDMATGLLKPPKKKVAEALDDYAAAKRTGDKGREIAQAQVLLTVGEAGTTSRPFVRDAEVTSGAPATAPAVVKLDGALARQVNEALLDAFPRLSDLTQMVYFEMGENLAQIATGNQRDVVFALVAHYEARGRVGDLIAAARRRNTSNAALVNVERLLTGGRTDRPPQGGDLLNRLSKMLPEQFDEVIFRVRAPESSLPSNLSPQGTRAIALIRWATNNGMLADLERAVDVASK